LNPHLAATSKERKDAPHEEAHRRFAARLAALVRSAGGREDGDDQVSGWHCGGCAARTEAALKNVKGVSAVASDKTKHVVKVTYDDAKVKRPDLEKAIAASGFSAEK